MAFRDVFQRMDDDAGAKLAAKRNFEQNLAINAEVSKARIEALKWIPEQLKSGKIL